MKPKFCFIWLLLLIGITGIGQTKAKIKFTSVNQLGIVAGETTTEFQAQTVNGVSYKKLSAGIGLGLDDYYLRTFPLFIDVRKLFFNKASAPFIYADAGYSLVSNETTAQWEMDRKGGAYYAAGVGYEVSVNGKAKLVLDIGYSYKRFSKIVDNEPWRSSPHIFDTYDYSLNRISIKGGLRF